MRERAEETRRVDCREPGKERRKAPCMTFAEEHGTDDEFQERPAVAGHRIQYHERLCMFQVDHKVVACTPLEYRLFSCLLDHAEQCVTYEQLLFDLGEELPSRLIERKHARNRLTHTVSGLRTKIWPRGLDIVAVMGVGYILLSAHPASA